MRRTLIGVLAISLVLAGAGCKQQSSDNGVATANSAKSAGPSGSAKPAVGDQAQLARQFQQCMKDHGVDNVQIADGSDGGNGPVTMNGPSGDSSGGPQAAPENVQAAMEQCKQYLPNGGTPPKLSAADLERERKHSKCMRENGVPAFPDPNPDGGLQIQGGDGLDPTSDTFKAAEQKCRSLQPSGGPQLGGGPGGGPGTVTK